jgi:hypothetical protein
MSAIASRSSKTNLIRKFVINVDPSDTFDEILDIFSDYKATHYFIEIAIPLEQKAMCASLNVAKLATDLKDQLYGKVGDPIQFKLSVLKVSSDAVMRIENNEANPLEITVIRITQ